MAAKGELDTATIGGREYVLVSREEYDRLTRAEAEEGGNVDAIDFAMKDLAWTLKSARIEAGFTQAELAAELNVSQPMIARTEIGTARIGEKWVAKVLDACRLPADWKGTSKPNSAR